MRVITAKLLIVSIYSICTQGVMAQQQEKNWSLEVGGVAFVRPEYIGSDKYEAVIQPYVEAYYAFDYKSAVFIGNGGLGFNYTLAPGLDIGVVSTARIDRKSSDSKILTGMKDIKYAVELGAYVEYALNHNFSMNASVLFDVRKVHKGWSATAGMSFQDHIGTSAWSYGFSLSTEYGNASFNNTYFGVSLSEATLTRSAFTAGSGFNAINFGGSLVYRISESWNVNGFMELKRLIGDASNSPIVAERNHITSGMSVTYTF